MELYGGQYYGLTGDQVFEQVLPHLFEVLTDTAWGGTMKQRKGK